MLWIIFVVGTALYHLVVDIGAAGKDALSKTDSETRKQVSPRVRPETLYKAPLCCSLSAKKLGISYNSLTIHENGK